MSSLKCIAILGRQPELGLIELESLLGATGVEPFGGEAALINDCIHIDRLGGAVKLGEVLYRGVATSLRDVPVDIATLSMRETKTPFSLSAYGSKETPQMLISAGLELKKKLRERGSVRLVAPSKGLAVSAAELIHNKVIAAGFELLIIYAGEEMILARTLGVQDINWYSRRDYDRPMRSAKVGMLPPKLAQILVNTTHAEIVYDPFCGTGVMLQEALLMGREARGSDLSETMVTSSRKNLPWIGEQVGYALPNWSIKLADARQVELPVGCAVVSEGYLGPNLTHTVSIGELNIIRTELLGLYRDCLAHWARQLPGGSEVSITVPAWRIGSKWHYLNLVDEATKLGYTLKSFEHVRLPVLYARSDQFVGRQLLLLRKN